jgi:acetolactate synthase I/II/III large subunit
VKASDYVAAFLADNGVSVVYELAGGIITHLLDSLHARPDVRLVSMHHEQAAAFAAEGGARFSRVPGVALATSGPGATNLLTGIASCFFDSVPVVFITGQVNTFEQRDHSRVRQSGFQETDIVAMAEPVTKAAWRVTSPAELPQALADAFAAATSGRMGPVLLDIPMDVQWQEVADPSAGPRGVAELRASDEQVAEVARAVASADRPLILAGGGASASADVVRSLAHAWGIPVVSSLLGLDVLPADDPLRVGFIGTYGNRWANQTLGEADLLLALGTRLDIRQTGADVARFSDGKTIVRVDVDPDELEWRVPADVRIAADVGRFASQLLAAPAPGRDWSAWRATIATSAEDWPDAEELLDVPGINVARFFHALSAAGREAVAYVADVGQNQMWAAQSLRLASGQRFVTSGGMGAMGFSLPAAIGVALAAPGRPVVAVTGDGGMQINIQELETVARLSLPVRIVVLDNRCLGMIRQFQDEHFSSRYQSTVWGYGAPDFAAVAEAYGLRSRAIGEAEEVDDAVRWLCAEPGSPALLHVNLCQASRVRPKVSYGQSVFTMEPPPPGPQAAVPRRGEA